MNRRIMGRFGPVLALRCSFRWFLGALATPFQAKEPLLAYSLALWAHYALGLDHDRDFALEGYPSQQPHQPFEV